MCSRVNGDCLQTERRTAPLGCPTKYTFFDFSFAHFTAVDPRPKEFGDFLSEFFDPGNLPPGGPEVSGGRTAEAAYTKKNILEFRLV